MVRRPGEPSGHGPVRGARGFLLRALAPSLFLGSVFLAGPTIAQPQLRWADLKGVVFQAGTREVCWGWTGTGDLLQLGFPAANIVQGKVADRTHAAKCSTDLLQPEGCAPIQQGG
jgi:hypothetical protein